jgi:hypothetical membrane protein
VKLPGPDTDSASRLCIVAGTVALATTVVVVGFVTPGYRPWADAVSRLGSRDEPHAMIVRAAFALYGVLVVFARALVAKLTPSRERVVAQLVGVFGVAAVVAGLAPKDPPRSSHTLVSQIHVASTLVGGAALLGAVALVARLAPDRDDRRIAIVAGTLTTVAILVFPFTWGSRIYGVMEILILTSGMGWLAVSALRASGRGATLGPARESHT